MIKIYNTSETTNKLEEVKEYKKGAWINLVSPSEEEIQEVCNAIDIDEEFVRYPLDFEEKARIDQEDDSVLFIIDVPIIEENKQNKVYTTMPLGLIVVRDDFFIKFLQRFFRNLLLFLRGLFFVAVKRRLQFLLNRRRNVYACLCRRFFRLCLQLKWTVLQNLIKVFLLTEFQNKCRFLEVPSSV